MTKKTKFLLPRRSWILVLTSGLAVGALYVLFGFSPETWVDGPGLKANDPLWRLSISLAYTTLVSLGLTLAVGPLNVLRGRPNPLHNPLRRDLGILTALLAVAHVSVGMFVHTRAFDPVGLFFSRHAGHGSPLALQLNFFGVGNLAGLFQLSLLVFLLILSNRVALRKLGVKRWKRFQQLSYFVLASVALHGFSYQRIEHRLPAIRLVFWGLVAAIVLVQAAGFLRRRAGQTAGAGALEAGKD